MGRKKTKAEVTPTTLLRVFVCFCLAATAVTIGTLAYYYLRDQQIEQFEAEYDSVTKAGLVAANGAMWRLSRSALVTASLFRNIAPASHWPNVTLPGIAEVTTSVLNLSGILALGVAPVLKPEDVSSWEHFAYDYFESDSRIPNGTGVSSFGKGIFKINPASTAPDKRERDSTGETAYGSPNTILTPLFQIPFIYKPSSARMIMFNWHSEPRRGAAIDLMIECVQENNMNCGTLTDFLLIITHEGPEF